MDRQIERTDRTQIANLIGQSVRQGFDPLYPEVAAGYDLPLHCASEQHFSLRTIDFLQYLLEGITSDSTGSTKGIQPRQIL